MRDKNARASLSRPCYRQRGRRVESKVRGILNPSRPIPISEPLKPLLEEILVTARQTDAEWAALLRRIGQASVAPDELAPIVDELIRLAGRKEPDAPAAERLASDRLWATLLERLWRAPPAEPDARELESGLVERVVSLYRQLGGRSRARQHLLRLLTGSGQAAALEAFAELMVSDPPHPADDAWAAFVPLFQRRDYQPQALFPRLLDALGDAAVATMALDLANYLTRQGRVPEHPAAARAERLAALLGGVVNRLARLEEHPGEFASSPAELNSMVTASVGLIVAIAATLALVGDVQHTGKLHQALALGHRRVRVEVAYALATLGDDMGLDVLAQLAAEPVVRARSLACLDELGRLDRAAEEHRTPEARAAGELAAKLALPTAFGVAPRAIELVDATRSFWPGYEGRVDCFLFRYEYQWGDRMLSGIGIAGPLTHALQADLADLPPADIYAAYAGYGAEHPEISELPADELSAAQKAAWEMRRNELTSQGYDEIELVLFGRFFDEQHFVATARRASQLWALIVDGRNLERYSMSGGARSLGPREAYLIHKGRKLLRAFNARSSPSG